MGGEYLAYLISQDRSFRPLVRIQKYRNRHVVRSKYPQDNDLKNRYVYDTDQFFDLVKEINSYERRENTIIHSHYDGDRIHLINNIVPFQLRCDYHLYSFFHTLAIIKIYCSYFGSDLKQIQAVETTELLGLEKPSDIVRFVWESLYLNWKPNNNYTQIDIGRMVDNPKDCQQIEKYFNIKFPVEQFAEKCHRDVLLIEDVFNISIKTFYSCNHIAMLEEYVTLINNDVTQRSAKASEQQNGS